MNPGLEISHQVRVMLFSTHSLRLSYSNKESVKVCSDNFLPVQKSLRNHSKKLDRGLVQGCKTQNADTATRETATFHFCTQVKVLLPVNVSVSNIVECINV